MIFIILLVDTGNWTNLICKVDFLLAIYFLSNLSFLGKLLHGFDHCLK